MGLSDYGTSLEAEPKESNAMKSRLLCTFLTLYLLSALCLTNTFAQDYTQLNLPEGAKARLGKGVIIDMRLSPDNNRLAIVSSTGVWLYDVNMGNETVLLTKNTELVGLLAFSTDGTTLAFTGGSNTCYIWNVENGKLLLTFNMPGGPFRSLKFLANGKTLVSRDWANTFSLWDITTGEKVNTFNPKASEIKIKGSIWQRVLEGFVDHNGHVIFAIGNHDGTISIQDGHTHKQIRTLAARTNDAAFFEIRQNTREEPIDKIVRIPAEPEEANDEKPFLTNYRDDGTPFPIQYQLQEYSPSKLDNQPMKWVKELAFSPDGKMLVSKSRYWIPKTSGGSVGTSGPTEIWNVGTGEQLAALPWYVDVRFSGDSKTLALISRHAFTRDRCTIWDMVEKRQLAEFEAVADVKFSGDGKTLAIRKGGSYDSNGDVIERAGYSIWDIATQTEIASLILVEDPFVVFPEKLQFSQDGTTLVTADQIGTVNVWETKTEAQPSPLAKGYARKITALAFTHDSKTLASRSAGNIHLWDTDSGTKLNTITTGKGNIEGLTFSTDNKTLNAVGFGSTVQWNIITRKQIATITTHINLNGHGGPTFGFDDGTTLAFSNYVYSPNFRTLTTKNGKNNSFELWDLTTREHLSSLTGMVYKSAKGAMALTPDGSIFATNNLHGTNGQSDEVILWDTHTDKLITTLSTSKQNLIDKLSEWFEESSGIYALRFSHDGKTLAVGIGNKEIQLWDVDAQKRIRILKAPHKYAICKLEFSLDDTLLASGDAGGDIRLWESLTGHNLTSYEGHKSNVSALVFSRNKKLLASISEHDGTIFLWNVPTK